MAKDERSKKRKKKELHGKIKCRINLDEVNVERLNV